jgi:hypothetical protein
MIQSLNSLGHLTIRCSPYRMLRYGPHLQCASRGDQRDFIAQSHDGDGWGARDAAIPRPLPALAVSLSSRQDTGTVWRDSPGARELMAVMRLSD